MSGMDYRFGIAVTLLRTADTSHQNWPGNTWRKAREEFLADIDAGALPRFRLSREVDDVLPMLFFSERAADLVDRLMRAEIGRLYSLAADEGAAAADRATATIEAEFAVFVLQTLGEARAQRATEHGPK